MSIRFYKNVVAQKKNDTVRCVTTDPETVCDAIQCCTAIVWAFVINEHSIIKIMLISQ